MRNTYIGLTVLLISLMALSSCKFDKNQRKNNLPYSKVEIYCACITTIPSNHGNIVMSTCSSPWQIPPSKFIRPEVLYYSTNDNDVIHSLENIFFKSKYRSDTLLDGTDARFVVLMKRNESMADTLVFSSQTEFTLNERYKLEYSINIIDSVRRIIGKGHIQCD